MNTAVETALFLKKRVMKMFKKGDMVVYESTGVCKISDIKALDGNSEKLYYCLEPLFDMGVIYSPVESKKVSLRPTVSKEEAEYMIDMIPSVEVEDYHFKSFQELTEHYKSIMKTHSCKNLIKLLMSIYKKRKIAIQNGKKMGQIDERFMKKAEDMLFGEFSVSLGMPRDEVEVYIKKRVRNLT